MDRVRKALIIIGGVLAILWGSVHLIPTDAVIKGFGNISSDNTRIITMEWINEGLTLIFIGALATGITIFKFRHVKPAGFVYCACFCMLIIMAIVSLFTGFGINFLPYKLCPVIFSLSGALIFQGAFIGDNQTATE